MAEVYLARHHGLEGIGRQVIVKRILPHLADNPEFVTMFLDEARLMASLSHPNIAQIYDLAEAEGTYYLAMEYVRGPTLAAMLTAAHRSGMGRLPDDVAFPIALAIAEAVRYVHRLKDDLGRPLEVVHRDLNPTNVLVSYDGAVKLIDFGIAKAATKVYETRTGVIKGTYGYIAPEQLTGRRKSHVDHRADIFAIGVLLYEIGTGLHPFETSTEPNPLDRLLKAAYRPPTDVRPDFPERLMEVVTRSLSPKPEDRPGSVDELIDAVVAHLADKRIVPTLAAIGGAASRLCPDANETETRPSLPPEERVSLPSLPSRPDGTARLSRKPPPPSEEPTALVGGAAAERSAPTKSSDLAPLIPLVPPETTAELGMGDPLKDEVTVRAPAYPDEQEAIAPAVPRSDRPPRPRETLAHLVERRTNRPLQILAWVGAGLLVIAVGVGAFFTARAIGAAARGDPETTSSQPPPPHPSTEDLREGPRARELSIVSEPPGASIHVNGRPRNARTPTVIELEDGASAVWIRVGLDGFVTEEREVQASAGEARFVLHPIVRGTDGGTVDAGAERSTQTKQRRRRFRRR
jgi:serine/threonine protein kinase